MKNLFNPKSIAIVGVSEDPTKLGSVLFNNLVSAGYQGQVFLVNPKHSNLYGKKCYKDLSDIKEEVDLICIAIPAVYVADALKSAAKINVKCAVIISAGFSELGDAGKELEKNILDIAKESGIRILGPNCLGAIMPKSKVNISFAASFPKPGNIAFFSQSGAVCTALLDMSLQDNLGYSHFISFGNKSDLNENDMMKEMLVDDEVSVISGYLEQIHDGMELINIYKSAVHPKPLIILKPGKSIAAQKAISSHTGSIAGSLQTVKTAFKQNGIIMASNLRELYLLQMFFSWGKMPMGNKVAVITNAGGPGILATDAISESNLEMSVLSEETKAKMKSQLPQTASLNNPVDVIGDALAERYKAPIDVLTADEGVDIIMLILTPQLVTQIEETARLIINYSKLTDKPIIPVFIGGKYTSFGIQKLMDQNIPAFSDLDEAVKVISKVWEYRKFQNQLSKFSKIKIETFKNLIALPSTTREAMAEERVKKLMAQVGIALPAQLEAYDIDSAIKFASAHYPVVVKAPTELIVHKSDQKALYLNIHTQEELEFAFKNLYKMLKDFSDNPYIIIQEMISAKEIFIGANRDGSADVYKTDRGFGHLVVFGKGGIYTEIFQDFEFALVPFSKEYIESRLSKTKVSKILYGARGQNPLAVESLIETIMNVQKLLINYPQIVSIDINPILMTTDRAVAVDVKIFTD